MSQNLGDELLGKSRVRDHVATEIHLNCAALKVQTHTRIIPRKISQLCNVPVVGSSQHSGDQRSSFLRVYGSSN
jgi:hypothetical protein